jgi:hypothetical protein
MELFEIVKTIGSLSGLLSGLFLVWDRMVKGRPVCSITTVKHGSNTYAALRINNVGVHDVAVLNIRVKPNVYMLSKDFGVDNLLTASLGGKPALMLAPEEKKELMIVPRYTGGGRQDERLRRVVFSVSWRRGNATWLPRIPVRVPTSVAVLKEFGLKDR